MTVTRTSESKLVWSAIHKVTDSKAYIYLFVSKTYAVIVPKRAFPNVEDAAAFYAAATTYHHNAVPGLTLTGTDADTASWPPSPRIVS